METVKNGMSVVNRHMQLPIYDVVAAISLAAVVISTSAIFVALSTF